MTEEKREVAEILLSNRLFLYSLLHKVFGREPDAELLKVLTDPYTGEAFGLLREETGDVMDRCVAFLAEIRTKTEQSDYLDEVKGEYTRLFIGPYSLPAPPWESVYQGTDDILFQEATLEVREIYRSCGLLPEEYPHVADDSLALELAFMAELAKRAEEALQKGDEPELKKDLEISLSFLEKHLLRWIPKFLERMGRATSDYLYPKMCVILDSFLKRDAAILKELTEAV